MAQRVEQSSTRLYLRQRGQFQASIGSRRRSTYQTKVGCSPGWQSAAVRASIQSEAPTHTKADALEPIPQDTRKGECRGTTQDFVDRCSAHLIAGKRRVRAGQ